MKIFVTGGTGFIGVHTVQLLAEKGHDLMLLLRNPDKLYLIAGLKRQIRFVCGDLTSLDGWKKELTNFRPEVLLHMAWEGLPDYGIKMCKANFDYGVSMFILAGEAGCKSVMSLGSCWEYADKQGELTENAGIDTTKIFPAFKNSLRIAGEAISNEYKMKFYWPRLFFVYGPGQRDTSLIPSVISAVRQGLVPDIKKPANRNDFIYVKDVADALVKILQEKPDGIVYNVGSGFPTSVSEIISHVYTAMGYENKYVLEARACIVGEDFCADISRIKRDIGWVPKFSCANGIKETVQYYTN